MAESTPELRIKGVIDLSGVRQDLATLQAQASRGISVSGTFAGEAARGSTSISAPAAAGMAGPAAAISGIAPNVYQSPALVGPLASGTPAESVGATVSASAAGGGGGSGSILPVGRGLTAMALVHAASHVAQVEMAYQQRLSAAGGGATAIAQAELRHRTDYDSTLFGVGRLGRALREMEPGGTSAGDVESILASSGRQEERIQSQERSLQFFKGLGREVDVATAAPGLARHLAQIDTRTGERREKLAAEIHTERDRETERYQAAVSAVRNQQATEAGRHAFGVGASRQAYFDEQIRYLDAQHAGLSGPISRREREGTAQVNSIDAAERQEARNDSAARRAGIVSETDYYNQIAGGLRGRAATAAGVISKVNAEIEQARLRRDENLPQIQARGAAQIAASNVEIDHARQLEQFRLRADAMVSKIGIGGGTAGAHLAAAAAAGQAGVLAADPQDVGLAEDAATQRYQGAVGTVVRQGAAGIAQWVRRRTAEGNAARRDVFHTAELQAQQNVAELQANRQPVAAGIAGILADTKLAVQALKSDDPEYTKQRDALRGLGVARLRAFQNSLADASQAVEVAPGSIAPGAGQGRVGAGGEDIGKRIADAIKEAMGTGGNASGGGAGNLFQKLERVSDSLDRFISTVLGG